MRKHGQTILLFLFISFTFLIVPKPYSFFAFILLGLAIALKNPYYFILFMLPIYYYDTYGKIFLVATLLLYLLLRLVWTKHTLIYLFYTILNTSAVIFVYFYYPHSLASLLIYYLISLFLGYMIVMFCGISKLKTNVIDFQMLAIILLAVAFSILIYYKPKYFQYYLIFYSFLIPFYLPWVNLILLPILYFFYPNFIFPLILAFVLFNYKKLFLYALFIALYYGVFKGNFEILDYSILLLFLCYIITFYKVENPKPTKNTFYATLANEFSNYLSDLDILLSERETIKNQFNQVQKEISIGYCSKCNKKSSCYKSPDLLYSFMRSSTLYNGSNYIGCPFFENFPRIPAPKVDNYYPHQAIKTLLYSYQSDALVLSHLNEDYKGFLSALQRERISYQNFIPSFYNLSYSIEIMDSISNIEPYLKKLSDLSFHQKLEYKLTANEKSTFISACAKPKIKLSYAHAILNKGSNTLSGDNFLIKKTKDGRQIFALSDGMGSGIDAYYASKELLEVVSSMLKYHFSTTTLLNFLSYVYEIKADYEAYATLDLLQVNLVDGMANLYKLGSTSSYLFSDIDKVFENSNLPLSYTDLIDSYEMQLKRNDILLLLSDGFTDTVSNQELKEIVHQNTHASASFIVEQLCLYAKNKNKELKDDCCVIVIKVN